MEDYLHMEGADEVIAEELIADSEATELVEAITVGTELDLDIRDDIELIGEEAIIADIEEEVQSEVLLVEFSEVF